MMNDLKANQVALAQQVHTSATKLADAWRLQGRWEDARTLLAGLLPVSIDMGDAALARHWVLLGRTLTEEGMFRGVDTTIAQADALNRALQHAEAAGDAALQGSVWDAKGMVLHAAFLETDRTQELEQELECFERGLAFRQQADDARGLAESLFHVGLVYGVVRRDHTAALPYFEDAYEKAQTAGDLVMASYAIRHIAFAHHAAGQIEAARQALEESLHLREEANFVPGTAFALMTLARVEAELGDKAVALQRLERAKGILEALGAASRVVWVEQAITQLEH